MHSSGVETPVRKVKFLDDKQQEESNSHYIGNIKPREKKTHSFYVEEYWHLKAFQLVFFYRRN